MIEILVDAKALNQLSKDIVSAKNALLGRLGERGYQLLRDEVPVHMGNLKQGVASPEIDYPNMEATLVVSARSARQDASTAEVFDKDGNKTKSVGLRPSPAYNYAEVVALGNKKAVLSPKNAKAFLIPVSTKPSGEGYLMIGGQVYITRRTRKGMLPNRYDLRAAKRLGDESARIAEAVLREFV